MKIGSEAVIAAGGFPPPHWYKTFYYPFLSYSRCSSCVLRLKLLHGFPQFERGFVLFFAFSGAWHVSPVRVRNPAGATDLGNFTRGRQQVTEAHFSGGVGTSGGASPQPFLATVCILLFFFRLSSSFNNCRLSNGPSAQM